MNVTFIGHASILVETRGISILSDPWWRGPCFGAQWWNYPLPRLEPVRDRRIDYIYISHGHHDHFHPGTLASLSREAKVLVCARGGLAAAIEKLGFSVVPVDDEALALGDGRVRCRILETHGGDTLMAIDDGDEVCVNINDALHSAPRPVQDRFVKRLKALYPRIDYVFCGYGVASHFPNCYVVPGKDDAATAARRQMYFNRQWARLIAELGPRFGFPFAADVAFLEHALFWVNEPTHNCERPTDVFRALYPASPVAVVDIAPGFEIRDRQVTVAATREAVRSADIRERCAAGIERANRYGSVDQRAVEELAGLLAAKLEAHAAYFGSYEGDYRFLIRLRNSEWGIEIEKRAAQLRVEPKRGAAAEAYDVLYETRLSYLKWALTRPYGDEILFVGSGGIFRYRDASRASRNLHRELMCLLRSDGPPATPRRQGRPSLVRRGKQAVTRLLGQAPQDLYDLGAWTVYAGRAGASRRRRQVNLA